MSMPTHAEMADRKEAARLRACARARKWAKSNPDRVRSYARAYYQKHKDGIKQRTRAWTLAHPPSPASKRVAWHKWYAKNALSQRKRAKQYRESHKNAVRLMKRAWRAKNRDKINAQKRATYWRKKGVAPRVKRVARSHEELIEMRRQQRLKNGVPPRKKKTPEELREYKRQHAARMRHERLDEFRKKQREWAAKNALKVRLKHARQYYKNVERSRERMIARVFLRKFRARFPRAGSEVLEQLVQVKLVIRKLKKQKGTQ